MRLHNTLRLSIGMDVGGHPNALQLPSDVLWIRVLGNEGSLKSLVPSSFPCSEYRSDLVWGVDIFRELKSVRTIKWKDITFAQKS